jgi:hypothetical protein
MIGDAPRASAFGLRNPRAPNLNMGLRRTFDLRPERLKFVFAAHCRNVANKVTLSGINISADGCTFGTLSSATNNGGSRDFLFSGRLKF